uniref:Palmitoyltransferase n=1 Tax=Zooxanthella nutricula TaxID=1333877 RepID=A0A6U6WXP4_9DINO
MSCLGEDACVPCGESGDGDGDAADGVQGTLLLPGPESTEKAWATAFPLSALPSLPERRPGYYSEPCCGISVVTAFCVVLVGLTISRLGASNDGSTALVTTLRALIVTWAVVAALCVSYLLFGANDEIARSPATCYPVPQEVAQRLRNSASFEGIQNAQGPNGRTYCVRCLVWRPGSREGGPGHHCRTCNRCVTGFDHHCDVFGRCITNRNLPCFHALVFMLLAGVATTACSYALVTPRSALELAAPPRVLMGGALLT